MALEISAHLKATAAVTIIASALMFANSASADDIQLKSANGLINLVGKFVEFTDNNYRIRTPTGELHISANHVTCEGRACPQFEMASVDLKIAVADATLSSLYPWGRNWE